jgi:hypothetical protein
VSRPAQHRPGSLARSQPAVHCPAVHRAHAHPAGQPSCQHICPITNLCAALLITCTQDRLAVVPASPTSSVRSGRSSSAPTKKHTAPIRVPRFDRAALWSWPVAGLMQPATADTPKATDPIRLASVIHHDQDRERHPAQRTSQRGRRPLRDLPGPFKGMGASCPIVSIFQTAQLPRCLPLALLMISSGATGSSRSFGFTLSGEYFASTAFKTRPARSEETM